MAINIIDFCELNYVGVKNGGVKNGYSHVGDIVIAKTVTNILKLSPTHMVSNIRHQHRCSPLKRNKISSQWFMKSKNCLNEVRKWSWKIREVEEFFVGNLAIRKFWTIFNAKYPTSMKTFQLQIGLPNTKISHQNFPQNFPN